MTRSLLLRNLMEKPGKKGYKIRHAPKDHPFRRLNEKIKIG
jgi:hypothetical protein